MSTILERFQHLGLSYNNDILSKAGYRVARRYDEISEIGRRMKEQKEGEEVFTVWNYPDHFIGEVDRIILDYVENKQNA